MKHYLSGILAIGLLGTTYAAANNPINGLSPIDNGTGPTCVSYEQSDDWGNFCTCYANFLKDNCETCTHYPSFLCGLAPSQVRGFNEYQDNTNCQKGVETAKSMPGCKRQIPANICTQQLVDFHNHCQES